MSPLNDQFFCLFSVVFFFSGFVTRQTSVLIQQCGDLFRIASNISDIQKEEATLGLQVTYKQLFSTEHQNYIMRSRIKRNQGITHSLTPFLEEAHHHLPDYSAPIAPQPHYTPLYDKETHYNPHNQRSRKHRLLQEKNTDIERENRRLYERLRKIKLKNAFQSEEKLQNANIINNADFSLEHPSFGRTLSKPLSLPQVSHNYSLNTTKSELNCILNDRKTFVDKYFADLKKLGGKNVKTEQLGNFIVNGWRVKVLLLDEEYILLRGRKGSKEMTKKYQWERVKSKMSSGLEQWVRFKFEFEED